jgi:hypothetical protein
MNEILSEFINQTMACIEPPICKYCVKSIRDEDKIFMAKDKTFCSAHCRTIYIKYHNITTTGTKLS